MNNFNFGEVLTKTWQTIWKHKVLWVFGILASCARGSGGGSGSGNSNYSSGSGNNMPFSNMQMERFMNQAGRYLEDNLWIIIVVILALLVISLIFFAVGMIGRAGMIKGTSMAEKGAERIAFGEVWSESLPYFLRILGLNFFVGLAFVALIIPFGLLGVLTAGIGLVCLIPVICLLIPVGWAVSLVVEQAQVAIVLEDLNILDGLKRGWGIVKSNPGPVIVMALILGFGGGIIGVIVSLPLIVAIVPIIVGMGSLRESLTPIYITLACCVIYMPVLIFLNGILTAYIQSAWALTYMKLSQPAQPKDDAPVIIEANA